MTLSSASSTYFLRNFKRTLFLQCKLLLEAVSSNADGFPSILQKVIKCINYLLLSHTFTKQNTCFHIETFKMLTFNVYVYFVNGTIALIQTEIPFPNTVTKPMCLPGSEGTP